MKIPLFVKNIMTVLEKNGFEAYIVGGSVRDLLLEKDPKDWDITTNARPAKIQELFADAKYENIFGTVLVPIRNEKKELQAVVEITTYRSEQDYSDHRRPNKVVFEDKLDIDLARRDFTINALAMDSQEKIVDLFNGQKDLRLKVIRTVGEPSDRFKEDALRMMRAVRLSCQLGFTIEGKTERAIVKLAGSIKFIAAERIRDELIKILASAKPYEGIIKLHDLKLLNYILPELEEGFGMEQNHHHIYNVFDHGVLALKNCPNINWQVRLAGLLHDIGKPRTRKVINGGVTFYNHEIIGAKMVSKIMKRLRFSTEDSARVVNLVRNHMFYYNVDEVTAASVRRLIVKVGKENLADLIDLRIADRLGSGVAKAVPYKLRHLQYMMDKVQHDPVSVKMLKINGDDLMAYLKIQPGPKIGAILDVLLAEVINNPKLNNKDYLEEKSKELINLELSVIRAKAKELISEKQSADDQQIKKSYYVK
jgi:putative nucleotidyltransferase with HDIG domain